jgi:hypothetical protein
MRLLSTAETFRDYRPPTGGVKAKKNAQIRAFDANIPAGESLKAAPLDSRIHRMDSREYTGRAMGNIR